MLKNFRLVFCGSVMSLGLGWLLFLFWQPLEIVVGPYGLLIPSGLILIHFLFKWKRSKWFYSGCIAGILIVLAVELFFGWGRSLVRATFKDGKKTIAIIEQYKKKNGHYPATLNQLVPTSNDEYYGLYYYNSTDDSFDLTYYVAFGRYSYMSETGEWSGDLPPGGPPYDIIYDIK